MKQISINAFKHIIIDHKNDPSVDFINVCTPAEYREKHIDGVRSAPLDTLDSEVSELNKKKTVYIHCYSGNRACQAIDKLRSLGVTAELVNVEGELMAWEEAGHETVSHTNRIPIMRQVMIVAGSLILIGVILTYFVSPAFIILPLFISVGLLVSGITGWCGMAKVLSKMPWNS
jgi:rhodanese-related sulfurtransferase